MIRFGLCCIFRKVPIRFRRTTAKYLSQFDRSRQLAILGELATHNAHSLFDALQFCHTSGIGAFRINSQILPLKTHPRAGYDILDLPNHDVIVAAFERCGEFAREHDLRTTFHPDQFILLNSPRAEVVSRSIADLVYQTEVADWVGADVINIHGGGAYGDKPTALQRLIQAIEKLPTTVRQKLTLENDDRVYTPQDLLPVCHATGVPLVYDVHHHRCLPDGTSETAATAHALATWNREPLFHLSSPAAGWVDTADPKPHHDFIDPADMPRSWWHLNQQVTVEVEAKAKELAVLSLKRAYLAMADKQ
jgi:UV DNA damage endonuclease